ncbi:MAG TPA: hypothetical protein V6D08_01325 [Candidatus Obscuribacterales bacterium]
MSSTAPPLQQRGRHRRVLHIVAAKRVFAAASCAIFLGAALLPPGWCVAKPKEKPAPQGTLLIPIAPKIDTSKPDSGRPSGTPASSPAAASSPSAAGSGKPNSRYASQLADENQLKPAPENISAEQGTVDDGSVADEIGEDTTLKGTIQLVADDTEYDQEKNTFLGTGNAVVIIAGENSKLEADTILYDQNNQIIDARGNVRIFRDGQLTTGSAFRFKVTSDEYLITKPDTEIEGATVIARKGYGNKRGLAFQNGTIQMPEPFHISSNATYGPISTSEEIADRRLHPEAYLPSKPNFKFKARKMVYERYKDSGNLTVFGGRLMFGNFGVPLPKFTATVGKEENNVIFPVTPLVGNILQIGGISVGPSFHRPMGRTGVFTVAPFMQIGGRNVATGASNSGKIGAGAMIGYSNARLSSHLAYASNSNLVVGDLRWHIRKNLKLQAGINRFLDDGIFGSRRARLLAEVVHYHNVPGIPFLSNLTFRTSGGFAQDNSNLLNLTPQYAKLFNKPVTPDKKFALRVQEQITASTHPIFVVGNEQLGAKAFIYGGVGLRAYSTGDAMLMAQAGPILNVYLKRVRLQTGYTQSMVRGKTPFVFDQFIQGNRSVMLAGDVKISKYLTLGASAGYNLNDKLLYQRTLTAAVGPEDFKVLFSYDTIRRTNRAGFDVLFGQPIPFDKLVLKGAPDYGQLGGI